MCRCSGWKLFILQWNKSLLRVAASFTSTAMGSDSVADHHRVRKSNGDAACHVSGMHACSPTTPSTHPAQ